MGMFVVAPSNHHLSHHHAHNATAATATALGVGVIPLLTATPCLTAMEEGRATINVTTTTTTAGGNSNSNSSIQFWQTPQSYFKKTIISDHGFGGGGDVAVGSASTSGIISSTTMTCQDCGNQAKRDCNHRRCRTCCKSRGFDCATHVKSTWVPASRRRQRQLMQSAAGTALAGSSASTTSATKKPRLISSRTTTSTSNTCTPPRSFDTTSSHHHQDASFMRSLPAQVRAPAVFKCVRVTAVEEGVDDEYAYQACVTISGHVFKGFLYDQGGGGGDHETTRDQTNNIHNLSELHLGGGGGRGRNVGGSLASSSPVDPQGVYCSSGRGLPG